MTWCLYALVRCPSAQATLRESLREVERAVEAAPEETRQYQLTEAVQKCEYLDWVVRESLRLHAPVTNTMRVCMREGGDEVPVSR